MKISYYRNPAKNLNITKCAYSTSIKLEKENAMVSTTDINPDTGQMWGRYQ